MLLFAALLGCEESAANESTHKVCRRVALMNVAIQTIA